MTKTEKFRNSCRMSLAPTTAITHRTILTIAVPIMLSNVTEPLIGVVNTSVVGQLPEASLIGGVAVGGLIFSFLFWGFGFLRLSTSGLSAQALGAGKPEAVAQVIGRSLLLGVFIGLVLLALAPVIGPTAISLMGGSPEVRSAATEYFSWRIFSSPAALANFAILGWFVGQGRSLSAFVVQALLNITNMVLSVVLVLHFHLGISGVGAAALVAEYAGLGFGIYMASRRLKALEHGIAWRGLFDLATLKPLLVANADIMVRTLCLLFAFAWFTAHGARSGNIIIAANAVLLNFFEVSAYLIDGFAYAAEALVGQAIGAQDKVRYSKAISLGTLWAMGFGLLASLITLIAGPFFIDLMSVNEEVRATARLYLPWVVATPVLGAACFLFDGIFTGALATRDMRNMMVLALAIYLPASVLLEKAYQNHGLWMGLCLFFLARSVLFAWRLPAIKARVFADAR
ncbi:MATE family efflux transporter [Aestuariivirga litoralis]|uniref:MATE family efflux transporter n=1 Tax=Aestuariivirga litoralis TaxID=2650924 RepID=UPI001AEE3EF8|nr:MATE family efflux transporter [Aestuariivirga litoralis]MBG1232856.1 MATE family efflux transporter [Aestuariivirga litoralis]